MQLYQNRVLDDSNIFTYNLTIGYLLKIILKGESNGIVKVL